MKWRYSIVLAIMFGFTQGLGAFTRLTPEQRHFLSVDGSLGYASLTNNSPELQSGSGMAATIGVGYRLFRNNFLFSTGVEGYYMLNAHSMSDTKLTVDMFDTEGDPFRMMADASDGSDICHSVSVNLPLLFGGEFRRFYFLVGPKLSYNLWGQAESKGILTTRGDYDRYIGEFENMPNHYFETRPITSGAQKLSWNLDILAHAEIGARLGDVIFLTGADIPKPKHRYYLAFYVDYGLLNIRTSTPSGNRLECVQSDPTTEPPRFVLTPAVMSNEMGDATIHQYSFGIKATILFELPQSKPCVMCKDDLRRKFSSSRSRKNNIYKD